MTTDVDTFRRRTSDAQQRLRERGSDGLVLFPSRNLRYLAGYSEEPGERHFLLFVPAEGEAVFFVPALSGDQIREASWVDDVRTWNDAEDPVPRIADIAAELDLAAGHLLVDDTMWALFTQDLRDALPDATFGLASEVLGDLRVRKDDAELDAMRRAGAVADETVRDLRAMGEEALGLSEAELAAEIEELLESNGGTGVAFETIVGAGPNGAKPHHHHGDREITPGEPVVLDFGTRVDGYPSDQTRTLVFGGEPSERFREVHEIVREAQQAGVDAVEPGVTAESVDDATREVIEDAGYGDEFIHRTGHGVGLDVHEEPYIVEGNERELQPGMVFSVEPGIYLLGEFGVRIEDLVVVTEEGCERLNDTDRGWAC
ncbi:aminopeptidase P family protein [Halolamina sp. CBA1230]|uniref:M24 family metallopeptidase n=1 Tax=Halolamina sp. CBA1230 TaxID=1853690 RepID=UPI0009A1506A|nr:Xaa-Pro peptidase family protein [Halolamina sp. CBA1230]QKY18964.1 aminopeptidase P family protein [Halolamina sp. CBA1230]